MESTFQFPTVAASDPSDVAVAIETANALWRRGEPQESVRWLRRAADSAEAEGDDMRALSLARAAADMQEEMRPSAPPPASRAPAAARPSGSGPPPLRSVTPSPASAAPPPRSATPPPLASASPAAATPTPAPRSATPPPLASASPAPRSATPPPLASSAARTSVPPAPKLEAWRPPAEPEPVTPVAPVAVDAVASASVAVDRATGVVAMASKAVPADVRAAVRVSVETFSKGNRTYIVRVLGEGETAPAGAREAFLVPIGRDVDFASGG